MSGVHINFLLKKKKKSFPVYKIRNGLLRNFELRGKFLSRLN